MTEKTRRIIQIIAQRNGVTAEEVEEDMRSAIRAGMSSNDPDVQAIWKQITPDGIEPSIDTLMDYIIQRMITDVTG